MKTEQQLPKNIRQIGSPAGHTKVYVEDYVITFLNALTTDHNTFVRGAILFGEKKKIGNDTIIFVRGAIEGQNLELDLDEAVFDDRVWREIYQQKDRFFGQMEVIGWALLRMGFSVRLNDKIKKTHFENFPGDGKVLYIIDQLEQEDAFYVYRGQDLVRQSGYYIYYEKNPMMQSYLIERNERIKEVRSYENMMEARRDEKVIRQFRERVMEKTKSSHRKGMIRRVASAAVMAIVIAAGGAMYYYSQNRTTIDFRSMVQGAVTTMGMGVHKQIATEKEKMPSTLQTQEQKTETTTTTEKKKEKTTQETEKTTQTVKQSTTEQRKVRTIRREWETYRVRKGDTLVSISKRRYGNQRAIQRIRDLNGIGPKEQIYPGQKLLLPSYKK